MQVQVGGAGPPVAQAVPSQAPPNPSRQSGAPVQQVCELGSTGPSATQACKLVVVTLNVVVVVELAATTCVDVVVLEVEVVVLVAIVVLVVEVTGTVVEVVDPLLQAADPTWAAVPVKPVPQKSTALASLQPSLGIVLKLLLVTPLALFTQR